MALTSLGHGGCPPKVVDLADHPPSGVQLRSCFMSPKNYGDLLQNQ